MPRLDARRPAARPGNERGDRRAWRARCRTVPDDSRVHRRHRRNATCSRSWKEPRAGLERLHPPRRELPRQAGGHRRRWPDLRCRQGQREPAGQSDPAWATDHSGSAHTARRRRRPAAGHHGLDCADQPSHRRGRSAGRGTSRPFRLADHHHRWLWRAGRGPIVRDGGGTAAPRGIRRRCGFGQGHGVGRPPIHPTRMAPRSVDEPGGRRRGE